jgi:hypothetical protein
MLKREVRGGRLRQSQKNFAITIIPRPLRATINWRYNGPNLMGCRGMGTEIGAGVSDTRTDPDFISIPL